MDNIIDFLNGMEDLDKAVPTLKRSNKWEYLSTGIESLNEILNGGIPIGKITEIFGSPGTCKSALGYSILRQTILKGGVAYLIDTENAHSPEWLYNFGLRVFPEYLFDIPLPESFNDLQALEKFNPYEENKYKDLFSSLKDQGIEFSDNTSLIPKNKNTIILFDKVKPDNNYDIIIDEKSKFLNIYHAMNIRVVVPFLLEQSLETAETILKNFLNNMSDVYLTIAIDSMNGVPSESETEVEYEDISGGRRGVRADIITKAMNRWQSLYNKFESQNSESSKVTIIVANHGKVSPASSFSKMYSPGGASLKFHQAVRILLTKSGDIAETKTRPKGFKIKAKVERNKVSFGSVGKETEYKFYDPSDNNPAQFVDIQKRNISNKDEENREEILEIEE